MNSIWLKIAGVVVVAVIVIVVIGRFRSPEPSPAPAPEKQTGTMPAEKPKTFGNMVERDKQFAQVPQPAEAQPTEEPPATPPAAQPPAPTPPPPPADNVVLPSSITTRRTLYFKPLEEEEDIAAQQLLPWVAAGRSIGRLPMVQYGLMVKACRQAQERWPDSIYAFRAKQALEEISERYAANYRITRQELDITRFLKTRPGTQAIPVDPIQR